MAKLVVSSILLSLFTFNAFAYNQGDLSCPAESELVRYIQVPVFHDLAQVARVENIPGLNLQNELRDANKGKTLNIYVEMLKPYNPAQEILIWVPGGPGQDHQMIHFVTKLLLTGSPILENYNVLAMDHRGVGCSRVNFPGELPYQAHYMRQAASDIDAIRKAIGGENAKINLWGGSYGSLLGQTYALLYPTHLNRLMLSTAVSSAHEFYEAGYGYEALLTGWHPELSKQLGRLWLASPEIANRYLTWTLQQMYSYFGRTKNIPEKMNEVLSLVEAKDLKGAEAALPYVFEFTSTMQRSIACGELFPRAMKGWGFYLFDELTRHCTEFDSVFEPFNYTESLSKISARTLLYGGQFDHVTPVAPMRKMSARIPNNFTYLDPHLGHGIQQKPACLRNIMEAFFSDANNQTMTAITQTPDCTAEPVPPKVNAPPPAIFEI